MNEYVHKKDSNYNLWNDFCSNDGRPVQERVLRWHEKPFLVLQIPAERKEVWEHQVSHPVTRDAQGNSQYQKAVIGEAQVKTMNLSECVVVCGYVLQTREEEGGRKVSQIEPVANSDKEELTDLVLSHGLRGPVNFW